MTAMGVGANAPGALTMLAVRIGRLLAAALALGAMAAAETALADEPAGIAGGGMAVASAPAPRPAARTAKLGLNKSIVVDLPRDARDVLVSNPRIADAVIRTPRRIYLTGIAVGQTDIIIFDRAGAQIVALDLQVERAVTQLDPIINRLIPGANIRVEVVNDNIVLTGTVKNAADAKKAVEIAGAFANGGANSQLQSSLTTTTPDPSNPGGAAGTPNGANTTTILAAGTTTTPSSPTSSVINLLAIEGEDQVQLRVSVAEVQRSLVKQLGIDWNANNLSVGSLILNAATALPFAVKGAVPDTVGSLSNQAGSLKATLRAFEQTGLYRTLAEPTLTAISGESANFLAGGEFPVPTGIDSTTGVPSITFKPFGVSLTFSPVVLSEGRISLRVKTEASELSQEGSVRLGDFSIPSLKVRRAETVMELPSGGSMVLGGLLQDNIKQSIAGLPGLKSLPILGTLFRSRDFQRDETELVIIVTPYLVKPVARTALARPDQGFDTPDDVAGSFLGRLNRVYGKGTAPPPGSYQGGVGYIIE